MLTLSKRPFASLFSLIAVCTFSGGKVSAESILWTGDSSNTFSIAENWSGANTPPQSDDALVFGTAGAGTLDNDLTSSAFSIEGITFSADAGAFVIGGNAFTLTGDIINHSANAQTINAPMTLSGVSTFTTTASGGNLILGGAINGGGQLVHQGGGTLVLTGINTLGGGVISNNGTLQLGDGIHAAEQRSGAGTNGADGERGSVGEGNEPTVDGAAGGGGGAGENGLIVNAGGSLNLSSVTTIVAGSGGTGGRGGSVLAPLYTPSPGDGGVGGDGGAGGSAIVVHGGTLSSLPSQSTVIGGAGGNGGETGYFILFHLHEPPQYDGQKGGSGGEGGAAVLFTSTGSWTNSGAAIGGTGGSSGRGIDRDASGSGGAGVNFSQGGALTNLGSITGGEGGLGGDFHSDRQREGDTGKAGGNGGTGVAFGVSGSLVNSGAIEGGRGGTGGDYSSGPWSSGTGGRGGDGGTAVTFDAGGSLANSGTISGGLGGTGGAYNQGGIIVSYGTTGNTGYGVQFSGGAGILTNQSGGIINGGVVMDDFANAVTLETGSTITGGLDMGGSTSSTLTLTGSGSQVWSAAVTGATSFAGSLIKEGDGVWEIDQAFHSNHSTQVNAGTLLVNASLAGDATVEHGATLGGAGRLGGDVIVRNGGTLSPGNSPGQMTIENNLTMEDGSVLLLEFGGASVGLFDQLEVQGNFTAGGTLSLMLINGFTPEVGAMFTIFNGTTPGYDSGSFHFTTNLGGGLYWDTSNLADFGTLTVIPEPSSYILLGLGALAGILTLRSRAALAKRTTTPRVGLS